MAESTTPRSAERSVGASVRPHATGFPEVRRSPSWRVWAPLLARAAAIGLALLGLAGIGLAAMRAESSPEQLRAPLTLGLAQLVGDGSGAPLHSAPATHAAATLEASAAPRAPARPLADAGAVRQAPLPCAPAPPSAGQAGPARRGAAPPGAAPPAPAPLPAAPSPALKGLTADGRVILNRASLAELQRLPGIGAKRAAAILELRERLGRFRRPSDLLRIKGIGPRLLERISPQLVLDE